MSERFMENIKVSAEVKTYLADLYHQIEYELRDDYEDGLEKALNRIDKAIEYIEKSKLNQLDTYCKYLHINFDTEKIENLDELLNILKGTDKE